jgi:hypothetical protein
VRRILSETFLSWNHIRSFHSGTPLPYAFHVGNCYLSPVRKLSRSCGNHRMQSIRKSTMASQTPVSLRTTLTKAIPLLLTLCTPFMLWKALSVVTLSPVPVVCVISESMAPAFHRGDLLFLWNRPSCVEVGEVPVVWFKGNPLPMVHRAIRVHNVDCEREDASKR